MRTLKHSSVLLVQLSLVLAGFALALAGCTSLSAGTPFPDPSGSDNSSTSESSTRNPPSSDDDLPADGVPKVDNPMDVSRFEQDPCDMLTPEQAQTLSLPTTGAPAEDAIGKGCRWHNEETRTIATIFFSSSDERGLSSVYREAQGKFPYFERIDNIGGYPAVAFHPEEKDPSVDCTVVVGVSDQLVFGVRFGLSVDDIGKGDPCESAAQVAGMMMSTMREAP